MHGLEDAFCRIAEQGPVQMAARYGPHQQQVDAALFDELGNALLGKAFQQVLLVGLQRIGCEQLLEGLAVLLRAALCIAFVIGDQLGIEDQCSWQRGITMQIVGFQAEAGGQLLAGANQLVIQCGRLVGYMHGVKRGGQLVALPFGTMHQP